MKVLGICGSLAQGSVNLRFLRSLETLLPSSVTFEVVTLHDIPMYSPDIATQPDSVQTLCRKIKEADRVVIATPEYNYSLPGVLKNALDWVSRSSDQPFNGKKTAIMGASPGNVGTARCQYHLRQVGVFLNIHFINRPEVMIGQCRDKIDAEGKVTDEITRDVLSQMVNALLQGSVVK